MRAPARVLVICLSSIIACKAGDGGEVTEENAGTEASDEATDEATDTDGDMRPWDEFKALCEQQSSRDACKAIPAESNEFGDTQWCGWVVEAAVQLDGDTCIFGAPISECRATSMGGEIGCVGPSIEACSIDEVGWSRMDGDTLWVGRGGLCDFPTLASCSVLWSSDVLGEPECACLCDPGFPYN